MNYTTNLNFKKKQFISEERLRVAGLKSRKRVRFINTGEIFISMSEAAKKTGYSLSVISNMVTGKKEPKLFEYA